MASLDTSTISDDVLLAAREGDDAALGQLWDACTPILRSVLKYCRPGPTLDLSDLVQEAAIIFLSVVHDNGSPQDPAQPPADGETFATALRRALRWRLYNYLRRERRRRNRVVQTDDQSLELALARATSGASASAGPPGRHLARALERLSPRQRAVVNGLYFRELDVAALSRELAVTPQAVTALHRRALASLRDAIQSDSARRPVARDDDGLPPE